jgi:membrane protein
VVVVVLTLGIMVDAPFMDENVALDIGVSRALIAVWYVGRWPAVLLVLVGFLACLYRFAPSVRHSWRHLLPGAGLGVGLWILAAVAFRLYLALGRGAPTGVVVNNAQVVLIGRAVGAVVATVLWTYFSSIAILVGNELNAELARLRRGGSEAPEPGAVGPVS